DQSRRDLHDRCPAARRLDVPRRLRTGPGVRARDDAAADRGGLMRLGVALVAAAALMAAAPAVAFAPTDPLASKQWYLEQDHAFDAWGTPPANLPPVTVAIIDSGIDATLPDFAGRIAGGRSFVGSDWRLDTEGHGTFVAGLIAANLGSTGIVGMAYSSRPFIA